MPRLRPTIGANPLPKPVNFGDEPIFMGRARNCEIVLHDKLASRKHAKAYKEQGFFFIEDLDSINGTLVNSNELKGSKKLIPGDVIKIGDHEILFDDSAAKAPKPPKMTENNVISKAPQPILGNEEPFGAPGTIYNLTITNRTETFSAALIKPLTTIGRGDEADVTIDEQLASRLHCHFENKAGGLKLVDLESRNGTKVNGNFVNQKYIESNDKIQIGETFITVCSRPPLTTGEFKDLQNISTIKNESPDFNSQIVDQEITQEEAIDISEAKNEPAPYLVYKLEDGTDKTFILHKDEITIGRSDDAVLTIQDKLSSRIHARIFKEADNKYFIEDLDSRNGTKINDREVKGKIELIPNDRLQIGEFEFQFIVPDQEPTSNNKAGVAKPAIKPKSMPIPPAGQLANKPRKKFVTKTTSIAGPMIGGFILVVVVIVVVIFFNDLDKNSDDQLTKIGEEPTPTVHSNYNHFNKNNNKPNTNINNGKNRVTLHDDDDDDDEIVNDGPEIDHSLDDNPDVNFVNAGNTEFERTARRDYITLRNNVWDNVDLEVFGKAYIDTTNYIKKYQNKITDEVFEETDKLLLEIKQKATKFWDNDLEPRIKNTPANERNKFYDEIQRAFEGYDVFYEPAIQMINN